MTELMTLEEIASYLRVTKKTVYRLLEKGSIPAMKVGHQWRFEKESIDTWLVQQPREITARILVIDDDATISSLFQDSLEGSGYFVTAVTDSLKGLELLKNEDFDMVFLDLKMPGMGGPELFRRIREIKPNLPVTIITGYPDSDLMMRALSYGPLGVMSKPFQTAEILAAIENYLRFGLRAKQIS